MSRVGVYALNVTKSDTVKHTVESSRAPREFLGSYQEVEEWRDAYLKELVVNSASVTYKVEIVLVEEVGPHCLKHLRELMGQVATNALMAKVLAGQLAGMRASDGLELNPDLTGIAAKIMQETAVTVSNIQAAQAGVPTHNLSGVSRA